MENKVDVLMATYNTNIKYLKEQIDSVLNQTYKNIALLISDDNSSNKEVRDVLKEYEKKDNRIKIYTQENNIGYIKNFEFLLKESTADYIMFSDHDDVWYIDKVEKSLKKLIEKEVDLVYCNSTQIDENGKVIRNNYFKYKNVPLIDGKNKLGASRCIGIGCSQIITKAVKNRMIPFKDNVMAHDWLAAFIANEGKGISYVEEPLFGYRLHNTNVFGGRSLTQNLARWKEENGKSYRSYLKYRKEKVIDKAYLDGAKMCKEYANNIEDKKILDNMIKYYESLEKSKYLNIHFIKYFKFLGGKNLGKKMVKEFIIFHLPFIGYTIFRR